MISFKPYGAKRLLKLAAILDKADAEHRKKGEPTYDQTNIRHTCGTPACALGHWAAATPTRFWLKPLLKYRPAPHLYGEWEIGEAEFGITQQEADIIFGPDGCNYATTAKQAARFIRKFVAKKLKEPDHE